MANEPAIKLMTKEEALESRNKINENIGKGAAFIQEANREAAAFMHREGWRALGYETWEACIDKEFSFGRRRIYQLLDEKSVKEELQKAIGELPDLSSRALLALKETPPGKRATVLKEAQREHKTKAPTGKQIAKTAKKHAPKEKKKRAHVESISDQAEHDNKLKGALKVIGDTCGRNFRKAIEEETVDLSRNEIITLAGLDDEKMQEVEKLVSVNRWSVARAVAFLGKMPTEQDRLESLFSHALAAPDGEWEGTFGAFTVTIKVNRRKL